MFNISVSVVYLIVRHTLALFSINVCQLAKQAKVVILIENLILQGSPTSSPTPSSKSKDSTNDSAKDGLAYSCLLKNELLSAGIEDLKVHIFINNFKFIYLI